VFLKNGVIADIGPHDDLMLRNQDYFELLNKNVKERSERGLQLGFHSEASRQTRLEI
jgi:hypothetical protein